MKQTQTWLKAVSFAKLAHDFAWSLVHFLFASCCRLSEVVRRRSSKVQSHLLSLHPVKLVLKAQVLS